MVLSEAGGWLNGDVAAGWPTVVALGAAEGVGVVAGGGGVVTLAGAAGLAVRACDRGGAVTVTVGTVTVSVRFAVPPVAPPAWFAAPVERAFPTPAGCWWVEASRRSRRLRRGNTGKAKQHER